ncbi:hypothetical protein [Polyangium mundeleinium]|uniref:Uncharacterized protein n=1 Tax=Polyangium mundeleinium TaxID=2995306 RepID=A0ABT5EM73_9BACT|nr:hypothetical protein [Polyangium mundeleinium]MDC0742569.1 hypothetical protein [Polyangium mundeleinium]
MTWRPAARSLLALAAWMMAPSSANADELLHHRLAFEGDRSLPLCDQALKFKALLVERVPFTVFDPPTPRTLVVRVRRAPNGDKTADVSVKDEAGQVLATDTHVYEPTTECFEVLYWTAIDAAKLMRATGTVAAPEEPPAPPAPPEPPPSPAPPPSPPPKPAREPERSAPVPSVAPRRYFLGGGASVAYNLAPEIVVGPRLLFGIERGAFVGEVDARWLPLLETRPAGDTALEVHTMSASIAGCLKRDWLLGCGILMGGAARIHILHRENYELVYGGFFGVGIRGAVEAPLTTSITVRIDAEGVWTPRPISVDAGWYGFPELLPLHVSGGASIVYAIK